MAGGAPTSLTAETASKVLARVRPSSAVVDAAGTSLLETFGISHVLAAKILGHTGPTGRFATSDAYANDTGTAPIEVSSGDNVRHRLSRSGNRQLNNAVHLAAHVQRCHPSPGQDDYLRKIAEGKTKNKAMRCLKRQVAKVIYRRLTDDAHRAATDRLEAVA